jgi:signal peptidase I
MEPNLHTGQFLIVSRLAYRLGEPQRGDIIVFHYPDNPSEDYVKRIIGTPGDTITVENGMVYINGSLLDEPYAILEGTIPYQGRWVVPDDSYFVLGQSGPKTAIGGCWARICYREAWFVLATQILGHPITSWHPQMRLMSGRWRRISLFR